MDIIYPIVNIVKVIFGVSCTFYDGFFSRVRMG